MRIGELAVLAGEGSTAAGESRPRSRRPTGPRAGPSSLPALRRLHGAALVQTGDVDAGTDELRAALEDARTRGDAYETALLLDLIVAIFRRVGARTPTREAELASLREQLGIIAMPSVPLDLRAEPERRLNPEIERAAGDAGGASVLQVDLAQW